MSIDISVKIEEIQQFCKSNANTLEYEKYNKYFKGEFDGVGIEQKVFIKQKNEWINKWNDSTTLSDYLDIGDCLFISGKFEEKSFIIHLIKSKREELDKDALNRIGSWYNSGITNWALCDVLCMLVLSIFIEDEIIKIKDLLPWTKSESEWQRRSVPVTLNELAKKSIDFNETITIIEPIMLDKSEYVQKGLGTLLRTLWKKHPYETETFLYKWKDKCARKIIQYATEKMDKEQKKKFKKVK